MRDDEQLQRDLTRIALGALEGHSFALAGSGAIREHGLVDRLTHDVDLFTNSYDMESFNTAVDGLLQELRGGGYDVDELRRDGLFCQLVITTDDGRSVDMDLGYDWRAQEPASLALGPVLNVEDAVATKVNALYSRQEARDYIDVDAIRSSGRFTDAELIAATARRDDGFEIAMFIRQLEQVTRIEPERFAEYDVDPNDHAALTSRFLAWADELRNCTEGTPGGTAALAQVAPELTTEAPGSL